MTVNTNKNTAVRNTGKRRFTHKLLTSVVLATLPVFGAAPVWAQSANTHTVTLGPFDQGVYSGSEPFAVTDNCLSAGDDCGNNDTRIRTNDILRYTWSVVTAPVNDVQSELNTVIFEQTINPDTGAEVQYEKLPAACLTDVPPSVPVSTITRNDNGSTTLVCNLGPWVTGEQLSFTVPVQPLPGSLNGAAFRSQQRVYGLNDAGDAVTDVYEYLDNAVYTVSSAPAFDLLADRAPLSRNSVEIRDIGHGPEPGFTLFYSAHLAADAQRGVLGLEPLADTFDFDAGVYALQGDGSTPYALDYAVIDCSANQIAWPDAVYGAPLPGTSGTDAVTDSGDCAISGDANAGYRLTVTGADTTAANYPLTTIDGTSLATGPVFVGAYTITVFVPLTTVDATDGIINNQAGELQLGACLSNFDPVSQSGVSNYGAGAEPGNNCTNLKRVQLQAEGEFSLRAVASENDEGTLTQYQPLISAYHEGDGLTEPGAAWGSLLYYRNNGSVSLNDFNACTVFDRSVLQLTDRGAIGATPGAYAYEGSSNLAGFNPDDWMIEYGQVSVASNPLDRDGTGNVTVDRATGRFAGDWSAYRTLRCNTATIEWSTEVDPNNIDVINAIRISPKADTRLAPGQEIRLITPLRSRLTFNGGAYDGQLIPTGTVAPVFAGFRSDELKPEGHSVSFTPSPENSSTDGDRVTIVRAQLGASVNTLSPGTLPGVVGSVNAGDEIVWGIDTAVFSSAFDGETVNDINLTVTLSDGLEYNETCSVPNATAPSSVVTNDTTGDTTLTWNLGSINANTPIDTLPLCTTSFRFAAAGSTVSVNAMVTADNAVTVTANEQTVTLDQTGALLTDIDTPHTIAEPGRAQRYTLRWSNVSADSAIRTPVIINVLPYDSPVAAENRILSQSDFTGTVSLVAEPVLEWTTGRDRSVTDEDGTLFYTADRADTVSVDPDTNTSVWCEWQSGQFVTDGAGDCPTDFTDVTAFKFESRVDLARAGDRAQRSRQSMQLSYALVAKASTAGDVWNSVFSVDSASLPADQLLVSARNTTTVIAYTITGDINTGINAQAIQDRVITDGVTVELVDNASRQVIDTTEVTNTRYQFVGVAPGDYVVRIPANMFTDNGQLRQWTLPASATINANIDTDKSDPTTTGISTLALNLASATDASSTSAFDVMAGITLVRIDPTAPPVDNGGEEDLNAFTPDVLDADNDTIPDEVEGDIDTDNDGIPNREDTDSDADGIPDSVEKNTDTDGDGTPDYIDTDSDADGISDALEGSADSDDNGVPDYIDNTTDPDTDGDGIPDSIEGDIDTDGDSLVNRVDTDSDGDGIPDSVETVIDTDGDGLANYIDIDSDNDSIGDIIEQNVDSDGDGIADYKDRDSDNDTLTDAMEAGGVDQNGDGIPDASTDANATTPTVITRISDLIDTDFDKVPNYRDLDSDNDSITDLIESRGIVADANGDGIIDSFIDTDGDGINDAELVLSAFNLDIDDDSLINAIDLDSDGDTRSDLSEAGRPDTNSDAITDSMTDSDLDGIQDNVDVDITNGVDSDNDGIDDSADINFVSGIDIDKDGIINAQDPDANGDGYADVLAAEPALSAALPDTDNDGEPDFQQPLSNIIRSGVGGEGIGCSIGTRGQIDPTLSWLLMISAGWLMFRRRA